MTPFLSKNCLEFFADTTTRNNKNDSGNGYLEKRSYNMILAHNTWAWITEKGVERNVSKVHCSR